MANVTASMRLKVKADTFFLPDSKGGGVYFRNNVGSFRMEGSTIDQWIEKLLPMFTGEYTMDDLADGLPDEYQQRIYDIAERLYEYGFVRDVSQDLPHQLEPEIVEKYLSQIEFLDNVYGSGAYRFQKYRQANVLAVGAGPFFVSLVAALLESGLPVFRLLITGEMTTNRARVAELIEHARQTDSAVAVEELVLPGNREQAPWREVVQSFDAILYVSQTGDVQELQRLHDACKKQGTLLLPAVMMEQAGMAGPLVHPNAAGCWESARRRVHCDAIRKDPQLHAFSSTAGAMLANVIVFELIKARAAEDGQASGGQFFLLDLETLEGSWHQFTPHPLVGGGLIPKRVENLDALLDKTPEKRETDGLLDYFRTLTAKEAGIFHFWEEGELKQLPLSQCAVQAVNPMTDGPAPLLPPILCTGLTHEEARRQSGLAGIEAYVSKMTGLLVAAKPVHKQDRMLTDEDFVGVGAGETVAEAVCRGLQSCLAHALSRQQGTLPPVLRPVQLGKVDDERIRFYLHALGSLSGQTEIALGNDVSGFPVVWVGAGRCWYGSVGLNVTVALRKALQRALIHIQGDDRGVWQSPPELIVSSVQLSEAAAQSLDIPAHDDEDQSEVWKAALHTLTQNNMHLTVYDLAQEPFLQTELAGVFGILLREGDQHGV